MTNNEARKIAEALDLLTLPAYEGGSDYYKPSHDCKAPVISVPEAEFIAWLDSPEGQQKIRDRVIKVWNKVVRLTWYQSSVRLELMDAGFGDAIFDTTHEFIEATESAAWLAALEFLTKEE